MGSSSYSAEDRSSKTFIASDGATYASRAAFYGTASMDVVFTQTKEGRIHDHMSPKGIKFREARDSAAHPYSLPIIVALDETGSMQRIPEALVREGLPELMGNIIQRGCADPSVLFLGIGDHEYDKYPLQVGQFESGDEELDMWLTRTYLEGGGGGNAGESYPLAWYFAAKHTATDAWEKRQQKGFLFTIGDEPALAIPQRAVKELMGETAQEAPVKPEELLALTQERYNVYHLHIMEGNAGARSLGYWKNLLGQNCIQVNDHREVGKVIADIVIQGCETRTEAPQDTQSLPPSDSVSNPSIIL